MSWFERGDVPDDVRRDVRINAREGCTGDTFFADDGDHDIDYTEAEHEAENGDGDVVDEGGLRVSSADDVGRFYNSTQAENIRIVDRE